ncbi:DUF4911 domain-containing protein [Dissulfuribacter thermophilus]|nr:DUF4911 domain-containing protein [Dissulfuribacter thermophilus]
MSNTACFRAYWFCIDPSKTHFLRFIFEGYDNEFQMTTVDQDLGLVRVLAMKGSEGILLKILLEYQDTIGPKPCYPT